MLSVLLHMVMVNRHFTIFVEFLFSAQDIGCSCCCKYKSVVCGESECVIFSVDFYTVSCLLMQMFPWISDHIFNM